MASEVFGVPPELVTGEMRSSAKAVNFGIVYAGISDFRTCARTGHSDLWRRTTLLRSISRNFPGVRQYMEWIVEQAKQKWLREQHCLAGDDISPSSVAIRN